jgi:methylglutaconyl-CoA hydratase
MTEGYTKLEIDNNIGTITFYSPKSNSLPSTLLNELISLFDQLSNDNNINVIILKSDGDKAFCAGASFDELLKIDNFEDGKEFFMGFARLINAVRKCSKIVIGRIHGKVVGGGVGLVSVCDYSLATENASLRLSELAIGLGPFVVGPPIERKIGKEAFIEMSLDCQWRTAEWGQQHGFYHKTFEKTSELDSEIQTFANELKERSPEALKSLKKVFWEGTDHWDTLLEERAENSGRLVLSDYTKNFIKQFKQKNKLSDQ